MKLRARLQRLERSVGDAGCPACRHRGRIVTRTATSLPDGTVVWDQDEPQPCVRCGQIPEQIIDIILPIEDERTGPSASAASA